MSSLDEQLIAAAANALNKQSLGDIYVADVGCALVSRSDQIFAGACVGGEFGVCAEQSAVSQLVSKETPIIKKIVAVWRDDEGVLHALPPCGRCRELMLRISQDNVETDVVLGKDHVSKLGALLPLSYWHAEPL